MSEQFFITATGTDIGKTFILQKLALQLSKNKKKFFALKPVISGFSDNDPDSDSAKILQTLKLDLNHDNLDKISPWRFKAALSPNIAANLENKTIDFDQIISFCQKHIALAKKNNINLLIEGAGGVMTPVTDNKTFCDLMAALKLPVILVIGNYLGTISHSLSAIKTLEHYGLKIDRIIVNNKADDNTILTDTIKTLKNFTDLKIITL